MKFSLFQQKPTLKQHALPITTITLLNFAWDRQYKNIWGEREAIEQWEDFCLPEIQRFKEFDPTLIGRLQPHIDWFDAWIHAKGFLPDVEEVWEHLRYFEKEIIEVTYA